jgi:hypothetical protein
MKTRTLLVLALCIGSWTSLEAARPTDVVLTVPSGLEADVSTCEQAILRWSAVPNAGAYNVVLIKDGSSTEKRVSDTFVAFPGLAVGDYAFQVKALGTSGSESAYSGAVPFSVVACGACKPPVIRLTSVQPVVIHPANHQMVTVTLNGALETECSVTQSSLRVHDEYGMDQMIAFRMPINGGPFAISAVVEATRNGQDSDGRVYEFTASGNNAAGWGFSNTLQTRVTRGPGTKN